MQRSLQSEVDELGRLARSAAFPAREPRGEGGNHLSGLRAFELGAPDNTVAKHPTYMSSH